MDDETIARFQAEIDKYPEMWDVIEAKAVFADKEGAAVLLGIYCTLCSGLFRQGDVLFQSPWLTMVKEVFPLSQLKDLLVGLSSGAITLAGRNIKVEGFSRFEVRTWPGGGQGWVDTSYPHVLLYSNGKSARELINEDEVTRQLLAYGYRDIYSLTQQKLGFQVGGAYASQIRVIAPIFFQASAAFADDRLRLVLECWPSLKASDFSASYEVVRSLLGNTFIDRGSLKLTDAQRSEQGWEGLGFLLTQELDLLPQAESARVWVFHNTSLEPMYALHAIKPATLRSNLVWGTLSLILTRQFGGQLKDALSILRDSLGLDNQVKDAGRLEVAIHALLGCAGLVCIFTGREWGIQGIDTLAFSPEMRKLFAVSVTTTNNISEKIRTILPPINKLRKELPGFPIFAAIVAPIEMEDVLSGDDSDAKAHGIRLILRPQLTELLEALMDMSKDKFAEKIDAMLQSPDKPSVW